MLGVVLDTNVLVAALRSKRGASHRVLESVGTGQWQPNISVALALEYEDVLKRPNLLPGVTEADVDGFLDYLFSVSNMVPFVRRQRPGLPDPDDDRILEVALQCQAVIVTHNLKDFAGLERLGVAVQSPADFLRSVGANR